MSRLIQTISELKVQLQSSLDERGKLNEELSRRDHQLITLKVDLASTDERLKLTDEEVILNRYQMQRVNVLSCISVYDHSYAYRVSNYEEFI